MIVHYPRICALLHALFEKLSTEDNNAKIIRKWSFVVVFCAFIALSVIELRIFG